MTKDEEDRARQVHEKSHVINGLTGFSSEIAARIKFYNIMKQGGLTAVNYTVGSGEFSEPCRTITNMFHAFKIIEEDKFFSATRAKDIRKAKKTGAAAIIFGFQNTLPTLQDIN